MSLGLEYNINTSCCSEGRGGGRSLSSTNILDPEEVASPSPHEMRRSRFKKSVSSDGIISSGGGGGRAEIGDSELPSLVPVVGTKSGDGRRRIQLRNY